jgi:hypothetical protein
VVERIIVEFYNFTPFAAAIAFRMASLLLFEDFLGFLLASRSSFSSLGNFFCLASASVCQARQRMFSNSVCSSRFLDLAISDSS